MSGLEVGSTLGGYEILARLRAGAMGVLYLARRIGPAGFARPVAIKVIHDHLAQNKRFCRMFIAEAKLCARIEDPHVVRVEEFGEADGRYYLVMEFVHGVSLAQALGVLRKRGGLPVDVSVAIAMDVASGLHAAHEATDEEGVSLGIVHRDVSPHNVLVSFKGYVKVIDFGIAKAKAGAGQTLTGSIRGKLAYMPPEQARSAKHVDRRADLYALGLILWEMLAGRRMFNGKGDLALLNQIRNPVIVPPSTVNPQAPKALDEVVLKLLEYDPANRPETGVEVARMLARAWPGATKVLAADIAAVMNAVREVATAPAVPAAATVPGPDPEPATASGGGDDKPDVDDDDDDPSLAYGEEVKKGVTLFDQGMQGSVEGADHVLASLASNRDVTAQPIEAPEPENATAVMRGAPIPPAARALRAQQLKRTLKIETPDPLDERPSGPLEDPTTSRPPKPPKPPGPLDDRPRDPDEITKDHKLKAPDSGSIAHQARPVSEHALPPFPPDTPYLSIPPPEPMPKPAEPAATKMPAWLSAKVLAVLTVVFVGLVVAFFYEFGGRGDDSRSGRTTLANGDPNKNANRSPLENAREAAAEGNSAAVRGYLESHVRSGKATPEEARLVQSACLQMGDTKCLNSISSKYPSLPRPTSGMVP